MVTREKETPRIRPRLRRQRSDTTKTPGGGTLLQRLQRVANGPRRHPSTWRGTYVAAPPAHAQHVVVKGSVLRRGSTGHRSLKGALHMQLDYLQREGVELDQARGHLYGPQGPAQADALLDRATRDSHHFQFVVSPEHGADLDLTAFTRGLLGRMEADLDTRLDWVAVNHHDTDHPHVHLIIRGVDEDGQRLYIRNDYLRDGIRFQAQDLATRELGWRQELTHEHALTPTHALSPAHTPNRGTDIGRNDDLGIGF
jgi:hypothetical protein